jgi:hypothetical protein
VGVRAAFYRANELRDDSGERSPVGAKLRVDSVSLAVVKMTDFTLFGGKYGFMPSGDEVSSNLHLNVKARNKDTHTGPPLSTSTSSRWANMSGPGRSGWAATTTCN